MNPILPDSYRTLDREGLRQKIFEKKKQYGSKLVILGHHYQRDEVIQFADLRGDSLELCQKAAKQHGADYIVFCGVLFMAESADILSAEHQIVQIPDPTAGCPLADFANIEQVEYAWNKIQSVCSGEKIIPITYINSDAELKAFCGRHDGITCTSSNSRKIVKWALERSDKIFFFPDQHLGRNTVSGMGISHEQISLWDEENLANEDIEKAKVILWNGYCHVHTFFHFDHVQNIRNKYPDAKIIVHPECAKEIVDASDASGSTGQIIQYVQNAPVGSTIAIGTETHLVNRLAHSYSDKKIIPLARSICPNMFKISLNNLCWTLDNLGAINVVSVPDSIKKDAKLALNRMLSL